MACDSCTRCCRQFSFPVGGDAEWLREFGEFLKLTRPQQMKLEGEHLFIDVPCQFLSDEGKCTIYDDRPRICRDFLCKKAKGD